MVSALDIGSTIRGTTFCLVDAPNKEAAECVHREAHGHIAGEVLEVAARRGRSLPRPHQRSRSHRPARPRHMDAGHRAILFTDIGLDRDDHAPRRPPVDRADPAHDSIVRRCLGAFDGREVIHTGDGIMAVFPTAGAALDSRDPHPAQFRHYNQHSREPLHRSSASTAASRSRTTTPSAPPCNSPRPCAARRRSIRSWSRRPCAPSTATPRCSRPRSSGS